jgi:hypothetical protein
VMRGAHPLRQMCRFKKIRVTCIHEVHPVPLGL